MLTRPCASTLRDALPQTDLCILAADLVPAWWPARSIQSVHSESLAPHVVTVLYRDIARHVGVLGLVRVAHSVRTHNLVVCHASCMQAG